MNWKSIKGLEGTYEVSAHGQVRRISASWTGAEPYIMSQHPIPSGYLVVRLRLPRQPRINAYVHRLVAQAFVANPNGYLEVNHIDGDKTHNDWTNIEWCSRTENNLHKNRVLKNFAGKRHYVVTSPEGVIYETDNLKWFEEQHDLGHGLAAVALGKRNHHLGWKCRYSD